MAPPRVRVKVRITKRFLPHMPGQRRVLTAVGKMAALMLRRRVDGEGRSADGPLPESDSQGWWIAPASDPRWAADLALKPRHQKGQKHGAPPALRVSPDGYRAFKSRHRGKTRRGQSLRGRMWAALSVSIRDRGVGRKEIRVGFAGSEKVGEILDPTKKSGKRNIRIANRDKATMAQYKRRDGAGKPAGRPDITLMGLTDEELAKLRRLYISRLRLFRSR